MTFIRPYLSYIDNGHLFRKPFSWLYALIGILNLMLPFYVLYQAIDNRIFDTPAKYIFVFLTVMVFIAFASWVGFQLWWDRKSKIDVSSASGDDFIATPVFSHFIQTLGEWFGTFIAIVGFGFAITTTIILGDEWYYIGNLGIPFLDSGWTSVITMPVIGFLTIVTSRVLAEQIRALSAIANNTKK